MTSEPARHRQGRWIVTWGASGGSLEASGTPTGPMDRAFASSENVQDPPRGACGAPEHVKKPSDSLHGAYVKLPETPKCQLQAFKQLSQQIHQAFQASKLQFSYASSLGAAECAERLNNNDNNNNDNSPGASKFESSRLIPNRFFYPESYI